MSSYQGTSQRLLPQSLSSAANDPVKLWVILHYPDSLQVNVCTLKELLDRLRSHPDLPNSKKLYMNKFQWTLSARVNNTNTLSKAASDATDSHSVSPSKASETCGGEIDGDFPVVTDYFCITAPVYCQTVCLDDDTCPHYVTKYTETVVVDLRYKCGPSLCIPTKDGQDYCLSQDDAVILFNDIADKVREIVIDVLKVSDKTKYRVYVLKPQEQAQNWHGVSPSPSTEGFCADGNIKVTGASESDD